MAIFFCAWLAVGFPSNADGSDQDPEKIAAALRERLGDALKFDDSQKKEVHYFAMRASTGKFVSADIGKDGRLVADRDKIGPWELFRLKVLTSDWVVIISNANGRYVCADRDRGDFLYADRTKIGKWEKFMIKNIVSNNVYLKSSNGLFVCSDPNLAGKLSASRKKRGEWETFLIVYN